MNSSFTFWKKNYIVFFILCLLSFFLGEFMKYLLDLNQLMYNSLTDQLSIKKVDELFATARKWQLVGYLLIPALLFIKTHLVAAVLNIGTFFFEKKIAYKKLWSIVLKAEFVFVAVILIKTLWIYAFTNGYSIEDIQGFYPLSMLSIVGNESIEPWYAYPLQTINVFEIIYWIVLALLLDKTLKESKANTGFKIVASSYGPALLIWVVGIMFFTLNMS